MNPQITESETTHRGVYPSKVDLWLTIVSWAALGALILAVIFVILSGEILSGPGFGMGSLFLATAGLIIWIQRSTRYVFEEASLRITSGPFRLRLALEEIHRAESSNNLLSSPALSIDRLKLSYGSGGRFVLISPEDREGFLAELRSRCPNLAGE